MVLVAASETESMLITVIIALYKDVKFCVRLNWFDSHWFDIKRGLKQGCTLSPMMFNININALSWLINK